ncbi:hypothetical protein AMJ57_04810 [Parcubacteria bacterium SG8_24]|nr:MAG: hypothetical protein AMJ57_04810 [Parcubacteria bacterium SG8_24]
MRKILIPLISLSLILSGAGCLGGGGVQIKPVKLEYWRIDDGEEAFAEVFEAYTKLHPNIEITYRMFRAEEYEEKLLEALAEDRGPDLFSIPNVWVASWRNKLQPMPEETAIPTQMVNEKKQIVTVMQKSKTLSKRELQDNFAEAVVDDVLLMSIPASRDERPEEKIWGLPLSLDTLGMFYNKELLRKADIEEPPSTWQEFQEYAKVLTVKDEAGTIVQSGGAIGLASNIRYRTELITAIMMQNGAEMTDSNGFAAFHKFTLESQGRAYPPGVEALIFYQSFALDHAPNYSWDDYLPASLDAFVAGKTAFYFGFPGDAVKIVERAPRLDFGMAGLPQVSPTKKRNVTLYPVEVVSKKTAYPAEAWDLILFLAREDNVVSFLNNTKRPTALRSLINDQIADPDVKPFVEQLLTAESWYHGSDWQKVDEAFGIMLETYPTERKPDYGWILTAAAGVVNSTVR